MNKTPIEWTRTYKPDGTWEPGFTSNPIRAHRNDDSVATGHYCEKISPGCAACYASRLQKRFGMPTFDEARSEDVTPYLDERELQKLLKRKKPCKVFLGDMTDVFGDWVPDEWLDQIFAVMALTPHITYQVLTKRADRMRDYIDNAPGRIGDAMQPLRTDNRAVGPSPFHHGGEQWYPLENVWCGVSAENQEWADKRIPHLLQTPAAVRFVSYEPALGPVDFEPFICRDWRDGTANEIPRLDWIICGGESGNKARPCDLAWIRSVVEQCAAAGTACFVKQTGSRPFVMHEWTYPVQHSYGGVEHAPAREPEYIKFNSPKGGNPEEWPEWMRVRQFPEVKA